MTTAMLPLPTVVHLAAPLSCHVHVLSMATQAHIKSSKSREFDGATHSKELKRENVSCIAGNVKLSPETGDSTHVLGIIYMVHPEILWFCYIFSLRAVLSISDGRSSTSHLQVLLVK